jgi:hypothetical protein
LVDGIQLIDRRSDSTQHRLEIGRHIIARTRTGRGEPRLCRDLLQSKFGSGGPGGTLWETDT